MNLDEFFSNVKVFSDNAHPLGQRIKPLLDEVIQRLSDEKATLMRYCDPIATNEQHKYGHKNGQSLVVFSDRAPNNSLPILHRSTDQWSPLFPRYF